MINTKDLNNLENLDDHNPPSIRKGAGILSKKAVIFIDGNNFYHNTKNIILHSKKISFQKLGSLVKDKFNLDLCEIRYYNSIPNESDSNYPKHLSYLNQLKNKGVNVITRELQGKEDYKHEKGIDVLIAVDMINLCLMEKVCEVCVLVSGDADFLPAMDVIKNSNKEVIVCSSYRGFSKKFREGKFRYFILRDEELKTIGSGDYDDE